jgi:hypothetical protein
MVANLFITAHKIATILFVKTDEKKQPLQNRLWLCGMGHVRTHNTCTGIQTEQIHIRPYNVRVYVATTQ